MEKEIFLLESGNLPARATAKRKTLKQRYLALKEAEEIRKSVYSILRQEQRPRKAQDMER